jgi:hypothetical protein
MSFSDPEVRDIVLSQVAQLEALDTTKIGPRGRAALVALRAIGLPTAAGGDPAAPPPTSPFPASGDVSRGSYEIIRRAAYLPESTANWALDKANPIIYRLVP